MSLSASISTGLVKGRFGSGVVLGPNGEKLLIPARGRIGFEGMTPFSSFPLASPDPITMTRPTATGILDSEGYLCTPDPADRDKPGERMVLLQAENDPDSTVQGWTWRATLRFVNEDGTRVHNTLDTITFDLPFGDVPFDLANVVSVPESPGIGTEQVIIYAASAQAAATSAAGSAEAAAEAARSVEDALPSKADLIDGMVPADQLPPAVGVTDEVVAPLVDMPETAAKIDARVADQVAGKLDADTADATFQTKTDAEQTAEALTAAVAEAKATADAAAALVGTDPPTLPLESVVVYGESTTHSGGTDWPGTVLASMLGVPVTNAGVAGQGAADILLRMGAIRPHVTLQGGAIPASGAVAVTSINPKTGWRINGSGAFGVTGTIAGVEGSLSHSLVDDTWTFTRATAGQSVPVAPGAPFARKASLTHPNHRMVLWTGRNNVTDGSLNTAADLVSLAPSALAPRVKKYVMIGVLNGTNEPKGHVRYNAIVAYNQRLAGEYGSLFYDLRRDFIDRGMSIAGLTPTTADTANIGKDAPPSSLMKDEIHPNDAGYRVVARLVAEKLLSLGWVSALTLPATPVEPDPTPDPPLPTEQVLTSDSFNRTNGALGATDAANGGTVRTWVAEANIAIAGGQLLVSGQSVNRVARVDIGSPSHHVKARFVNASTARGSSVVAGYVDSKNYYRADNAATGVAIYKVINGASSPVFGPGALLADNDELGLILTETSVTVTVNGTEIGSTSEGRTLTGGSQAGVRSAWSTETKFDDFMVTDK